MQSLETKSSRPRPKSFETETRPETFETETPKNGSRDWDQVSRLHRWYLYYPNKKLEQKKTKKQKTNP